MRSSRQCCIRSSYVKMRGDIFRLLQAATTVVSRGPDVPERSLSRKVWPRRLYAATGWDLLCCVQISDFFRKYIQRNLLAVCHLGDIYSLSVRVNCQQQTLMQATPCGLSELITVVGRGWAPVSVYIVSVCHTLSTLVVFLTGFWAFTPL